MGLLFRLLFSLLFLPLRIFFYLFFKLKTIKKISYLKIEIKGNLSEAAPTKGWFTFFKSRELRFYELIIQLNSLWHFLETTKGKNLKKIIFFIKSPEIGWARAWELREIILKFSEKIETYAYLEAGDHISYYLATSCRKIGSPPALHLEFYPISIEQLYFRGFFDRLGIKPNFLQIGEYKSFAEIFTRKEPSLPNRKQLQEIVHEIQKHYLKALEKRNPKINLNFLSEHPIISAQKAFSFKLIDAIHYKEDLDLEKTFDLAQVLKVFYYARKKLISLKRPKRIALIVGEGPILESEESVPHTITDFDYGRLFDELEERNYSALICRFHSPGGSAYVSDLLWQKLYSLNQELKEDSFSQIPQELEPKKKKEKKKKNTPLYLSLSDVAASGGYYLSAVGGKIYTSPLTITGSIGVIAGKFNVAPLAKRLGINHEEISLAKKGSFYSFFSDFSPLEKKALEENMKNLYELFLNRVSLGRNMPKEDLEKIAKGRVYTGEAAKKIGLVDELASLFDILEEVRKELSIKTTDFLEIAILPVLKPSLYLKKFFPLSYMNKRKMLFKKLQKNLFWFIDLNFLRNF